MACYAVSWQTEIDVSMPEMDIEYSLLDEDGFETSISFDKQVNKYVLTN